MYLSTNTVKNKPQNVLKFEDSIIFNDNCF